MKYGLQHECHIIGSGDLEPVINHIISEDLYLDNAKVYHSDALPFSFLDFSQKMSYCIFVLDRIENLFYFDHK
jgi:hypothetical protein